MKSLKEKISIKNNSGCCLQTKGKVKLNSVTDEDLVKIRKIYDKWIEICNLLESMSRRKVNFPEGVSEILVAYIYGFVFLNQKSLSVNGEKISTSFDCLDMNTGDKIQVKACSVEDDVTSFGPKSKFDRLIFADFYNTGKYDGTFVVYDISVDTIENTLVNSNETLQQQADQKRRPRLSLKDIIKKEKIKGKTFQLTRDGTVSKIEMEEK